jgi:hypothetical protein
MMNPLILIPIFSISALAFLLNIAVSASWTFELGSIRMICLSLAAVFFFWFSRPLRRMPEWHREIGFEKSTDVLYLAALGAVAGLTLAIPKMFPIAIVATYLLLVKIIAINQNWRDIVELNSQSFWITCTVLFAICAIILVQIDPPRESRSSMFLKLLFSLFLGAAICYYGIQFRIINAFRAERAEFEKERLDALRQEGIPGTRKNLFEIWSQRPDIKERDIKNFVLYRYYNNVHPSELSSDETKGYEQRVRLVNHATSVSLPFFIIGFIVFGVVFVSMSLALAIPILIPSIALSLVSLRFSPYKKTHTPGRGHVRGVQVKR